MNPEVVAWLRSPQGEAWSRARIRAARQRDVMPSPSAFVAHAHEDGRNLVAVAGFFAIREG